LDEISMNATVKKVDWCNTLATMISHSNRVVLPRERTGKIALITCFHELGFFLGKILNCCWLNDALSQSNMDPKSVPLFKNSSGPLLLIGLTRFDFDFFGSKVDSHNSIGFFLIISWPRLSIYKQFTGSIVLRLSLNRKRLHFGF